MRPIRSRLVHVAVLAAVTLLTSQIAGAASHHHHAPAPDAHERAWCDGEHAPHAPGVDHEAQDCQACRQRVDDTSSHQGEATSSQPALPSSPERAWTAPPPSERGVWTAGSTPTRGPPLGS